MALGLVLLLATSPANAAAQTAGNSGAAVAGAALGMAAWLTRRKRRQAAHPSPALAPHDRAMERLKLLCERPPR